MLSQSASASDASDILPGTSSWLWTVWLLRLQPVICCFHVSSPVTACQVDWSTKLDPSLHSSFSVSLSVDRFYSFMEVRQQTGEVLCDRDAVCHEWTWDFCRSQTFCLGSFTRSSFNGYCQHLTWLAVYSRSVYSLDILQHELTSWRSGKGLSLLSSPFVSTFQTIFWFPLKQISPWIFFVFLTIILFPLTCLPAS